MSPDVPQQFQHWYDSRRRYGGFPAKGTMAGALVVLERLKVDYDLGIDAHTAGGGSQIRGASGTAVRRILARFGETRPFVSEGGRTNRGLRGDIEAMLDAFRSLQIEAKSAEARTAVLEDCQRFLVGKVRQFHSRRRLEVVFDPTMTIRDLVRRILEIARERGQSGQVAQYLVGAKLALRFRDLEIPNNSYSTADQQLGRLGDFVVRDTAFHVTMTPTDDVYGRCRTNVDRGMRAYLLVPEEHVQSVRTRARDELLGRVAVESIESFVGQNVEEMAAFSQDDLEDKVHALLLTYNQRVDAVEVDKSVMIEIPPNLSRRQR